MQKREQMAIVANSRNWVNEMVKFGLNCIFTVDWINFINLRFALLQHFLRLYLHLVFD